MAFIDLEIKGSTTNVGEISKKVQDRRMRWYGHVRRKEGDGYRSARQREERKTEEEVGGLCERRSEREGTARRGGVRPSCTEATIVPHQPHIEVG